MKAAGRIVVVGTLNIDQVWTVPALPHPGQTILADAVQEQLGGKGANQAVAAARQGARVTLVGAVGADDGGTRYRERLIQEGIDTELLAQNPRAATGTAHVYVDPSGENLIVVDRGANGHIDPGVLPRALEQADVLLVQLESALPVVVEALRLAADRGVRALLNASPTNAAFPWGGHPVDTVIVNEHECAEIFARTPAGLCGMSAVARRDLLAQRKIASLVVTRGAEPTLHFSGDAWQAVPAHRVDPRDTVGAGDTFAGTLAAELARGSDWAAALRRANIAAALSTLALGAQAAMPRRAEVDAVIAGARC